MDNEAFVEILKWAVGPCIAAFLTWLISRRKEKADITKLITEASSELVKNLREDIKDLREQADKQEKRIDEVECESKALMVILRRWAVGIQKNAVFAEKNGFKLPWFPDAEDLKMVE